MSRLIQIATVLLTFFVPLAAGQSSIPSGTGAWRTDPSWNDGKAEWALYDASCVIYGVARAYATYRQLVNDNGAVPTTEFCYFPGGGEATGSFRTPDAFSVHDALTLTLRDYPFGTSFLTAPTLDLVADLTSIRKVDMSPSTVTIDEVGDETISVPYGSVRTHHLRLHRADGTHIADYWFAAEPGMRNVLVQYEDDAGTRYRLKRFAWWAHWAEPRPTDAESTKAN